MGHQTEHVPLLVAHPGDVVQRAVGVGRGSALALGVHIAEQDLAIFAQPLQGLGVGEIAALAVLDRKLEELSLFPRAGKRGVVLFQAQEDLVLADPNQLQQVFLNVIMNAADALTEKDASLTGGAEKKIVIKTLNTDRAIQIWFSDTGPGIRAEELVRIFDPFYTTKEPGKGTGLGLSVCYRIVEGMGGTIRAESASGEGTSIIITLPIMNQENGGG